MSSSQASSPHDSFTRFPWALITGGGSGIGAATGELVCAEGGMAVLVDANADALASTAKAIAEQVAGAQVATFVADVADAGEAARAVERTLDGFSQLDVLVNNASKRNYSAIADASPAEWQAVVSVNPSVPPTTAGRPCRRCAGAPGRASSMSRRATPSPAAKAWASTTPRAGVLAMTRTLAFEEAAHGVRERGLSRLHADQFPYLESESGRQSIETLKTERQTTSLRALGNAVRGGLADRLARQRRSVFHYRRHAHGRRRSFDHIAARPCRRHAVE
jgi:meso-butanediol dehydrogenase/(S,S)-butanediol dehydrogenase/diacetyl reductase